jgi:hypothetical protein
MSSFGKRKGGGRRSAARLSAPLIAVVTTFRESRSAVLVDVSSTGAKLRGRNLPAVSEDLFVTIDGTMAFGTVAWEDGDERGVAFDEPLRPGDEARLRDKVAHSRGLPPEFRQAFEDWTQGLAR